MTKKFWLDWQKRIGETKQIYGWYENSKGKCVGGSLVGYLPFKILSAKFNDNIVDLKLEIKSEVWTFQGIHTHVENKYLTLHREDISTVEFKTY
jgi:hypothetical protein